MAHTTRGTSKVEKARFITYDGIELVANLYLPSAGVAPGGWSPGIVVCHGFGSNKEHYQEFGPRAAEMGYVTLIPDLRGHGESGGDLDANIFNDVAAAVLYLQNRSEVNPMSVAIRGASMGGWLAIHTAAHLMEVSPVVAYCPTNESQLLILMEEVGLVQRGHTSPLVIEPAPRVDVNSFVQLLYRIDVYRAARRLSPRHLLLVHCEGDEVVPPYVSERIYDDAREPKTLWMLPGGDHQFAQHDPEIDDRMLKWVNHARLTSGELSSADIVEDIPEDF